MPPKPGANNSRLMGNPRYKYVYGPYTYDVHIASGWRGELYPTKVLKSGASVYEVGGRGDVGARPEGTRRLSEMTVEERRQMIQQRMIERQNEDRTSLNSYGSSGTGLGDDQSDYD